MRVVIVAAIAAALALVATACGDDDDTTTSGGSDGLTKVTFVDAAPFKIDLYPFNLAKELGYFEDEGLDVQLEPVDGTEIAFKQVAAGRAQFGYGSSEGILLGAAEFPGDVKAFYDVYNTGTFQIYSPADGDVASMDDLKGKSIGVEALNTGEAVFTRIAVANAGLAPDDVTLVPVGEDTANEITALESGRVDAVTGPLDTEVGAQVNGVELSCLTCDTPQPVSAGLFVNAEFAEQSPEAVEAFGRAIAKATVYGQENQERVLEVMEGVAPEQFTDAEFPPTILERAVDRLDRGEGEYGTVDLEAWQRQVDYMQRPEAKDVRLDESIDLDTLLITDLDGSINDFDPPESQ